MAAPSSERDRERMRTELGFQRWQAIGHFLIEADYLAFHRSDYRGAIAEYEKAWELLTTPWQRQIGGPDLLEGMAFYALRSEDPELARETLHTLVPRVKQVADPAVQEAIAKLSVLAGQVKQ